MIGKTLIAFTLMYISTSSANSFFNLVLDQNATDDVMNAMNSSHKIDSATRLILEQPALLTSVPADWEHLKNEQERVKATARTWRSSHRTALFKINDNILSFTEQFFSFYDYLKESARNIRNADTRADFVAILGELNGEVLVRKSEVTETVNRLSAFNHSVSAHVTIVGNGLKTIESKYVGQNGKLQEMKVRLAALEAEYDRINAPVTVTEDPKVELEHARAARANFSRVLVEKQQLARQLEELEFMLTESQKLNSTLIALADNVNLTVNAVSRVAAAWNQLDSDYEIVIATFETSSEGNMKVVQKLEAAKRSWQTLARLAGNIKRSQLSA